jgi:predicted nucleic acid-binding protein
VDAFDADVLIHAAKRSPTGSTVLSLFDQVPVPEIVGVGSLVLLVETLPHPVRLNDTVESRSLRDLLARLDLRGLDEATADVAVELAAAHRLKAADAIHLATALDAGANRFITNNRRDFASIRIDEIEVVFPDQL